MSDRPVITPETVEVGTPVTQGVGSDSYPYIVVEKSPSGKTITIGRVAARVVSGSWTQGPAPVIEYGGQPVYPSRSARWNAKRQRWMCDGYPISVGTMRYYQDPSF